MVKAALHCVKGGANTMRALITFEKYETTNYDVGKIRRYGQNILQWNKIKTKSIKMDPAVVAWR